MKNKLRKQRAEWKVLDLRWPSNQSQHCVLPTRNLHTKWTLQLHRGCPEYSFIRAHFFHRSTCSILCSLRKPKTSAQFLLNVNRKSFFLMEYNWIKKRTRVKDVNCCRCFRKFILCPLSFQWKKNLWASLTYMLAPCWSNTTIEGRKIFRENEKLQQDITP